MSGYKRVNYYELCRLCTSSEGNKMHIFREEGKRRQLSSKLQSCLPLQICEDDSLPKTICNHCADKLDTFYDFRNTCVKAESMLEGYFSSLRHSQDFIREGKVYVKDGSSPNKKTVEEDKSTIRITNVHSTTMSVDLENLVQTAPIQIVQSSPVSQRSNMVKTPAVRFYQAPSTITTSNVAHQKTGDTSQNGPQRGLNISPQITSQQQIEQGTTYYVQVPNSHEDGTVSVHGANGEMIEGDSSLHQTITFTPNQSSDMLVHFGFNKENKSQSSSTTVLRTDDRSSLAHIGEFLQMKTVVVDSDDYVEEGDEAQTNCGHCGQDFTTAEMQDNHCLTCPEISEDKGGERLNDLVSFGCDHCGKMFKRKEHLFQHRKLHTAGERPFVCSICNKSFSRKEHLVRHSLAHTGQRKYACDMCEKSFSRKDNLYKHRKTHGMAGPYECEICGKSFVVKHYYLMHKNTHAEPETSEDSLPYRCDVCYKGFSVEQYLNTHRLRHRRRGSQHGVMENASTDGETSTINSAAIAGTPVFLTTRLQAS